MASPQPYSVPSSLCVKPQNSRSDCQSLPTVLSFQRSMDRPFHQYLGMSAGQYYIQIRLSHARALAVETNLSLYEIAFRTGFSSPSTLARAYRMKFGKTLRQKKAKATST